MAYMGCHMYNENDDEIIKPATDVFEINDFTAATEWENFIDDIENVLRNWKLSQPNKKRVKDLTKNDFMKGSWKCRKEKLVFYDFQFLLYHYKLDTGEDTIGDDVEGDTAANVGDMEEQEGEGERSSQLVTDLMSSAADFCPVGPQPALAFGLREVLVLGPDTAATQDTLGNDTRAKMVVGAVNIALSNTGTQLPCLVQVMDTAKQLYSGTWLCEGARTEMSTVCLNKKPAHCNYLSGLLELYRNKVSSPLAVSCRVSARLSYRLDDWAGYAWMIEPPDLDLFTMSGDTDFIQLARLPFGCVSDPVAGLTLHTSWRDISEDLVTDTQVHSDLDPMEAPEWSVEVTLDDSADCLLARHLDKHLQLCSDTRSVRRLVGELGEGGGEAEQDQARVTQVLDKMSGGSAPGLGSLSSLQGLVRPLHRRSPTGGPLRPALVRYVLGFLFPDSEPESRHSYRDSTAQLPDTMMKWVAQYTGSAKTCPPDSLVWRLAQAAACCLQWAGAGGVAHLWHEVCLEIRYRLEQSILLPGLPGGNPDTQHCLLLQKLQMLNCCIARKLAREAKAAATAAAAEASVEGETVPVIEISDNEEEEEFFECDEEMEADPAKKTAPAWATAEGRVERIGDMKLLEVADSWMWRPEVQEPPPVTEDQLAEMSEVMMQLGTDGAGAELRAKMQSASLLSDMESFKAANPGCVLADFVRWHSPRDWSEERGLSCRMVSPGNIWAQLWETAGRVPARRQRRLFDDTREGEKVMSLLCSLCPGDLASLLHPVLLQAGHYRLLEAGHDTQLSPATASLHTDLVTNITRISRLQCVAEVRHYRGQVTDPQFAKRQAACAQVSSLVAALEMRISQSLSLRKKFLYDLDVMAGGGADTGEAEQPDAVREMERFVLSLGGGGEVAVLGAARGPAGRLLQNMFKESAQEEWPREAGLPQVPSVKQFVIRGLACRPLPYSQPRPQRLWARLEAGQFRLAAAFTRDTQYS